MGIDNFMAYVHSFQRGKPEILLMLSQDVVLVHQSPKWGVHSSDSPLNEGLPFLSRQIVFLAPLESAAVKTKSLSCHRSLGESVTMMFKEVLTHPEQLI